ncbi:hypothetical protein WICPIJ_004194 [Wickerhamomyces pijperi]|uniref:Uncharacterized protein n=1 Tax=Wickerhamomyces pijperi TaxID=599730 RepID=A0A9P8TN08_WICPI|nr:hypothetical protein WICPIJ_004194 [Wickerhamomyces pijperi]
MSENSDLIQKLQNDIVRLERLYSEQVQKNQSYVIEQETAEVELLQKDRLILKQSKDIAKLKALNSEVLYKLEHEFSRNKSNEELIQSKSDEINRIRSENNLQMIAIAEKYESTIFELESEIQTNVTINTELRSRLSSLNALMETLHLQQPQQDSAVKDELIETEADTEHEDLLADKSEDELSDDDEVMSYTVLTQEAAINEESTNNQQRSMAPSSDAAMEKGFEVNSLKKEVSQLYDYINSLLKNEVSKSSNTVLKQKLVKRGILRVSSINQQPIQNFKKRNHITKEEEPYLKSRSFSLNVSTIHERPKSTKKPIEPESITRDSCNSNVNEPVNCNQNSDCEFEGDAIKNYDIGVLHGVQPAPHKFQSLLNSLNYGPIDVILGDIRTNGYRDLELKLQELD